MLARIDSFDVMVQGGGFTIPAVEGLADGVDDFQTTSRCIANSPFRRCA
jgi:hypothetical protein